MEDDEDDFFAYQTARSLNNKRTQLKQFFEAPVPSKQSSSSSQSDSDDDDHLISLKTSKTILKNKPLPIPAVILPKEAAKSKDSIQNEIDAIVNSCFASRTKEVKRKVKLGKRTAADDHEEFENEDEDSSHLLHRNRNISRAMFNSLNKSQLEEEEEEKVTRETAAYDRLNAVLRVTKPLCEKQFDDQSEDEDDRPMKRDHIDPIKSHPFDTITLSIEHSDGRQLSLSLPPSTTLKQLSEQVAERLSLPSIDLVYNNQTFKLDQTNQSMTLKQLNFSSTTIQLLESYPKH